VHPKDANSVVMSWFSFAKALIFPPLHEWAKKIVLSAYRASIF